MWAWASLRSFIHSFVGLEVIVCRLIKCPKIIALYEKHFLICEYVWKKFNGFASLSDLTFPKCNVSLSLASTHILTGLRRFSGDAGKTQETQQVSLLRFSVQHANSNDIWRSFSEKIFMFYWYAYLGFSKCFFVINSIYIGNVNACPSKNVLMLSKCL